LQLRRERIAERMKALQELVPNSNKTDKASMLDEIIDYLKFLQLQVKILSMSRLGGAGAVASTASDPTAEVLTSFCQKCNWDHLSMWFQNCKLLDQDLVHDLSKL
jgi:hypothetical protein